MQENPNYSKYGTNPSYYTNDTYDINYANNKPSPSPIEMQIFSNDSDGINSPKPKHSPFYIKNRQDFLDVSRLERRKGYDEPFINDNNTFNERTPSIRDSVRQGLQKGIDILTTIKDELTGETKKNKVDENQERKIVFTGHSEPEINAPNIIRNQKYTVITLIPVVLFNQFKFFSNLMEIHNKKP